MKVLGFLKFPLLDSAKDYQLTFARDDLIAGVTLALLAVPQCMAYALIAGLPPVYGLYAATVGVILGSILSSSEYLILGPTAGTSIIVGGILVGIESISAMEAVIYLALLVGIFQVIFGFLRIGNMARFVSQAVITGFITGLGVVIIGDQIIYLLKVQGDKSPYFVYRVYQALLSLTEKSSFPFWTLMMGMGSIAIILLLRQLHQRMPAGLITIFLGASVTYWFELHRTKIEIIRGIPGALPQLTLPSLSTEPISQLISGAVALTLLASVQTVSIAKSLASNTRSTIDENQELFSLGFANLFAGLLQGFPISASFSRSFFNYNLGARTRFAGVFCGFFIVLTLLVAAPLAYYIPIPVLVGLVIVVVADVFEWEDIKVALMTTQRDQVAFIATFFSTLLLKLDLAIYTGVAVSLIFYLRKASHLDLKEYIVDENGELKHITDAEKRLESQVALIDVNGEAFFGSAEAMKQRINNLCEESPQLKVIVLRMKNAMNLDITGAMVLKEIALDLKDQGRTLMLCGTTPGIRDVLTESAVNDVIGEDKILVAQTSLLESTRQALERARAHIDNVLEGEESREEEEEPPLDHTMEQLKEEEDKPREESHQDPIEKERFQAEEE